MFPDSAFFPATSDQERRFNQSGDLRGDHGERNGKVVHALRGIFPFGGGLAVQLQRVDDGNVECRKRVFHRIAESRFEFKGKRDCNIKAGFAVFIKQLFPDQPDFIAERTDGFESAAFQSVGQRAHQGEFLRRVVGGIEQDDRPAESRFFRMFPAECPPVGERFSGCRIDESERRTGLRRLAGDGGIQFFLDKITDQIPLIVGGQRVPVLCNPFLHGEMTVLQQFRRDPGAEVFRSQQIDLCFSKPCVGEQGFPEFRDQAVGDDEVRAGDFRLQTFPVRGVGNQMKPDVRRKRQFPECPFCRCRIGFSRQIQNMPFRGGEKKGGQ